MYVITKPNELYHHGVLGMKWGIRRYQNANGSLTPAGKKHVQTYKQKQLQKLNKRYDDDIAKNQNKATKAFAKADLMAVKGSKQSKINKQLSEASTKQMSTYVLEGRKKAEADYINKMSFDDIQAEKREVGKERAETILKTAGALAIGNVLLPATTGLMLSPLSSAGIAGIGARSVINATGNRIDSETDKRIQTQATNKLNRDLSKYRR